MSPVGMDASISVKPKETDVFARLENIIVMNVDSLSIHKKVIAKPMSCWSVLFGDQMPPFICPLYVWCLSDVLGILGLELKMEGRFQVVKPAVERFEGRHLLMKRRL